MTDQATFDLDAELDALAREVNDAAPRPGPDLMARVLADAGAIAADIRDSAPAPAIAAGAQQTAGGFSLRTLLFGWTGGAVAAMALALVIGMGVGMQLDPAGMPLMAAQTDDSVLFAAGGGLFGDDFL